ncbi:MAG: caspase family protein [Candidatus Brocadia sp.]|nr:caspase family protein [Candidatus Brocadia sp.]
MAKKALLVGVNKYKYERPLNGCINDVRNMTDVLTSFYGFSPDEIRTITDDAVTRNNLMNRFDWLLDGAREGDLVIFHFSGHGSQIRDRDGDELDDGLDEILCLHDMDFRNPDSYLTDDDFNNIIDRLPKGVFLTICIDSCHSGTATRDLAFVTSELQISPAEMKIQPRFIEPPADIVLRSYGKSLRINRLGSKIKEDKTGSGMKGSAEAKHVLLAGCMDDQTSADAYINNDYAGAFTYYLCKTIRDARGMITYEDLVKRVQNSLSFNSFSQTPQLSGNKDLKKVMFLSAPEKGGLACKHGYPPICKDCYPLVYQEGYPPEDYVASGKSESKEERNENAQDQTIKRILISTKRSKYAISQDIILPSASEFIGVIRDLTKIANSKTEENKRNVLGDAYNPGCLDSLETSEDFKIEKVLEFCPNEQRAFGVEELVKPIHLAVRCEPGKEVVLLSYEDGVWSWHFKENEGEHSRDLITPDPSTSVRTGDNRQINFFRVPFKIQDRTTRGLWSKVVHVIKFSKDWIQDGSSQAIRTMLEKYEKEKITEGFKLIEHSKGFVEDLKLISDWGSIKDLVKDNKRALLFIHGTASSLSGGYENVPTKILEALKEKYPLILGYDHVTLSVTPEDNAKNMFKILKDTGLLDTGLKFDVVTHSRGGLVLRSFVELVGGCRHVEKVIMVACPAGGTNLANPGKWASLAKTIDLFTNIFFFAGGAQLKVFFNLVGGLIKFASTKLEKPDAVPGIWAMNPHSEFIKNLNQANRSIDGTVTYNTIGSDFEPSGFFQGGIKDDIADSIADVYFGDPNDLVVDTDKMVVSWPKGILSNELSNFKYRPEYHVYHLNYFSQAETYRKFSEFLGVDLKTAISECF